MSTSSDRQEQKSLSPTHTTNIPISIMQILRTQLSRPVFGTVDRHSHSHDEQGCRGANGATELCPKKIPVTVVMQGCTDTRLDRHQHEIQIQIQTQVHRITRFD